MSPSSSPLVSPRTATIPHSHAPAITAAPNHARISLPSPNTSAQEARRRSALERPSSLAKDRMSSYSVRSNASSRPSRGPSALYAITPSSLWYTQVRDFAYPSNHPWHYGSPLDASTTASGQSTPALDSFSSPDMPQTPLALRTNWSEQTSDSAGLTLAPTAYGETVEDHGPPYSEDEDLQSPVVISSRSRTTFEDERQGYFTGTNGDGSENYYLSDPAEEAGGPGGVLETFSTEQVRHGSHSRHISHSLDPSNTYFHDYDQAHLNVAAYGYDAHRLSRDYSFTIASPDEEMHGKAVALFDFAPENDNELPLVEGQVIWVSYRNGQGWLVAEDPKTRETGLVPEEYVRLFKHIEAAGWQDLVGENQDRSDAATQDGAAIASPVAASSDELAERAQSLSVNSNGAEKESYPAVQSTFSTSSKDLDKHPLPAGNQGQPPPGVHQRAGSQVGALLSPVSAILSPAPTNTERRRSGDDGLPKGKDLERRMSSDSKKGIARQTSKSSKRASKGAKR